MPIFAALCTLLVARDCQTLLLRGVKSGNDLVEMPYLCLIRTGNVPPPVSHARPLAGVIRNRAGYL